MSNELKATLIGVLLTAVLATAGWAHIRQNGISERVVRLETHEKDLNGSITHIENDLSAIREDVSEVRSQLDRLIGKLEGERR